MDFTINFTKPDWLGDIKLFSVKKPYMLLYNILSNIFPATGSKRYWTVVFQVFLSPFLSAGTTSPFFHSVGNFPFLRHDLNINNRDLQIEASQNFYHPNTYHIMTMRFICSRFLTIFRMTSLVKWIVESNLCFLWKNWRKITVRVYKGTLFCKKTVKYFSFLFKVCDEFMIV